MSFSEKIISGLLWGQLGMLGRTLICFIISILVARALGAEQYGVYAAVLSIVIMLSRFTEIGSQSILNTYIPKFNSQNEPGKIAFIIRKILLYRIIIVAVVVVAVYIIEYVYSGLMLQLNSDFKELLLAWFVIRAMMDCFVYLVWANMAMKYYAIVEILVSLLQLIGVLVLREQGMSIFNLIMLMMLVNGSQLIAYAAYTMPLLTLKPQSIAMRPVMRFGLTIWTSTVLHYFISKGIDIVMIVHFTHDTQLAAYYDIAFLLVMTGALGLLYAIDSLKLPILSEAYSRHGMDGLKKSWAFLSKLSIYLSLPVLVFLILYAEIIIQLLYGDEFKNSVVLVQVFAGLTLAGVMLANEVSPIILIPLQKERLYLYLHGSQGILNLFLNIWLIPIYGAMGAIIATGGARLLLSLIELIVALKIMQTRLPFLFIFKLLTSIAIAIGILQWLPVESLTQLLLNAIIFAAITTLLLLRFYRFNQTEQAIIKTHKPQLYTLLLKYKLI